MARNTKFTAAGVEDYIAVRGREQQRADCRELIALFEEVTQLLPGCRDPASSALAPIGTTTRADALARLHRPCNGAPLVRLYKIRR
jgi:hypothetical protein